MRLYPTRRVQRSIHREPTDRFDPDSLWWRHELLHRAVLTDPKRLIPLLADERDRIEKRWISTSPHPSAAFDEADEVTARWIAAIHSSGGLDRRSRRARRYWDERNHRSGMPIPIMAPVRLEPG